MKMIWEQTLLLLCLCGRNCWYNMSFRAQTYLSVVSFIHFVEIMPIHDDQDIDDERVGSWEAVAENNKPAVGRFHSQVLLIVTKNSISIMKMILKIKQCEQCEHPDDGRSWSAWPSIRYHHNHYCQNKSFSWRKTMFEKWMEMIFWRKKSKTKFGHPPPNKKNVTHTHWRHHI